MAASPFSPQQFGKFTLVEKIAVGGMAEVYRAVLRGAAGFEKTVALKRILPLFSSEADFVTLFQDEARIASTLTHGNLVQTIDFGEVGGAYYLALELVEGTDLARLCERLRETGQPFPAATAAFVVAEAARGLGYAHDKRDAYGKPLGIIHRDVSPQNLLLSYAGEVKVADFGIAKAAEKAHRTATGLVMGKLRYMAPEQVAGDELDARADIFSLGVILYELVTGGPIFREPGARVAELVHAAPIVPPSERAPGCAAELERIIMKALGRPREVRYARASELARDLSLWINQSTPGFTRDDLAALVTTACPPGAPRERPAAEVLPSVTERAMETPVLRKVTPSQAPPITDPLGKAPSGSPPRPAQVVSEPDVDPSAATELRQLDVPTRTRLPNADDADADAVPRRLEGLGQSQRTARTKKKGLSATTWVSLGFVVVILASLGVMAFRVLWGQPDPGLVGADAAAFASGTPPPGAIDAGAPPVADAAPAPAADPLGFVLTPRADAATQRARTAAFDDLRVARAGVPTRGYQLLMTCLDHAVAHLTLDERGRAEATPPLPPTLAEALAAQGLDEAYAALTAYVRDFGVLPPQVSAALRGYLSNHPAVQLGEPGAPPVMAVATLALWLAPTTRDRSALLVDLATQLGALGACAPPVAPKRHFVPVGCERDALATALRAAGRDADALRLLGTP